MTDIQMISISYGLWTLTCLGDNTHAFVIEVKDKEREAELLDKVESYYRKNYPGIRDIKQFVLVRKTGRDEFSDPVAYIVRDRYLRYVITKRDIELELRNITRDDVFTITDAKDYKAADDEYLLGHPTGCPWIPASTF